MGCHGVTSPNVEVSRRRCRRPRANHDRWSGAAPDRACPRTRSRLVAALLVVGSVGAGWRGRVVLLRGYGALSPLPVPVVDLGLSPTGLRLAVSAPTRRLQ